MPPSHQVPDLKLVSQSNKTPEMPQVIILLVNVAPSGKKNKTP